MGTIQHETIECGFNGRRVADRRRERSIRVDDVGRADEDDLVEMIEQLSVLGLSVDYRSALYFADEDRVHSRHGHPFSWRA